MRRRASSPGMIRKVADFLAKMTRRDKKPKYFKRGGRRSAPKISNKCSQSRVLISRSRKAPGSFFDSANFEETSTARIFIRKRASGSPRVFARRGRPLAEEPPPIVFLAVTIKSWI